MTRRRENFLGRRWSRRRGTPWTTAAMVACRGSWGSGWTSDWKIPSPWT